MPQEEKFETYIYVSNGKECFTSNIDLAWKRSDEGTEPKLFIQYDGSTKS